MMPYPIKYWASVSYTSDLKILVFLDRHYNSFLYLATGRLREIMTLPLEGHIIHLEQ